MTKIPTPYTCIIFHKNREVKPIKMQYVWSIYYLHNWLLNGRYDYYYMNIYNRKTGRYIRRQYSHDYVINKPPL